MAERMKKWQRELNVVVGRGEGPTFYSAHVYSLTTLIYKENWSLCVGLEGSACHFPAIRSDKNKMPEASFPAVWSDTGTALQRKDIKIKPLC